MSERFDVFDESLQLTVYLLDKMVAAGKVVVEDLQPIGLVCMLVCFLFNAVHYAVKFNTFKILSSRTFVRQKPVMLCRVYKLAATLIDH